ncbi:pseudaminic acid CMP-transferase [Catenovulum agarivorans DS-2]|uniref:Pseudaminic acid CMP-transferase n=1 Tax=Catenovulum agarivorans DS-2 TaxID=1328313 RepID=W7QW17_9ALTE|nr:pseudaminic acid cytidylyltransferase [Catenovulum agarivorans]EWH09470.1 pseudaminic acid CMP-transferase [Catenovulum agarivorans DS-2]
MSKSAIAIIPARGGSKRIPKKNIKLFEGKPLISYSIAAAKQTGLFDKIIVSTDSEEIAEVAQDYGADIPFIRPKELADDFTGTTPVVNHAINYMRGQGHNYQYTCCIYATAPLLTAEYLLAGFNALQTQPEKCFAFSVCTFPFPVQRALQAHSEDVTGVEPMYKDFIGKRSQDLVEAFHDAGQFYWGRSQDFVDRKGMFAKHSIPIFMPRSRVQDIDTLEDWQTAELMYRAINFK